MKPNFRNVSFLFSVIILFLISFLTTADESKYRDSLQKIISGKDAFGKATIYNQLSRSYAHVNADASTDYAKLGYKFSVESHNDTLKGISLNSFAQVSYTAGDYKGTILYADSAAPFLNIINNKKELAFGYNLKGLSYMGSEVMFSQMIITTRHCNSTRHSRMKEELCARSITSD